MRKMLSLISFVKPFNAHCCHMGTAINHPVYTERQSARMSKIKNDGLTRSGTTQNLIF